MSEPQPDPLATVFADFRAQQGPLVQPAGLAPVRATARRRRHARVAGVCALALVAIAGPASAYAVVVGRRAPSTVVGPPAATTSPPTPTGPTTPTPTPATPTSTPPPTPTPTGPPCRADQLTVRAPDGGAMASREWVIVVLTNTSTVACHLNGYPDLRAQGMLAYSGDPARSLTLGITRGDLYMLRDPGPSIVDLAPGASASFGISTATAYPGPLYQVTELDVVVPGERRALTVAVQIAGGSPGGPQVAVELTAIVPGAAGPPKY
jgi:uncharacterized protein DUF4232